MTFIFMVLYLHLCFRTNTKDKYNKQNTEGISAREGVKTSIWWVMHWCESVYHTLWEVSVRGDGFLLGVLFARRSPCAADDDTFTDLQNWKKFLGFTFIDLRICQVRCNNALVWICVLHSLRERIWFLAGCLVCKKKSLCRWWWYLCLLQTYKTAKSFWVSLS